MVLIQRWGLRALVVVGLAACSADETVRVAGPGTLSIRISSPEGYLGALLISLEGPSQPSTFEPLQAGSVVESWASEGVIRIVIFGDLTSGEVASFPVPDVGRMGDYQLTLMEVGGRDNELRSPDDFELRLSWVR